MEFKSPQVHFVGKIKTAEEFCEGVSLILFRVLQSTLKLSSSLEKTGNLSQAKTSSKASKSNHRPA